MRVNKGDVDLLLLLCKKLVAIIITKGSFEESCAWNVRRSGVSRDLGMYSGCAPSKEC